MWSRELDTDDYSTTAGTGWFVLWFLAVRVSYRKSQLLRVYIGKRIKSLNKILSFLSLPFCLASHTKTCKMSNGLRTQD